MGARAGIERRRLRARGVVQGVGFRPFVHRVATRHRLSGWVRNDGDGVVVEAEGEPSALDAFAAALVAEAPPLARIASVESARRPALGESGFAILPSPPGAGTALVPPDAATCDDCLRELFDSLDRRHRYPFVNCTRCGPRLTIVTGLPYDRERTTMAGFALCPDCRREYEDPADRRFHAEPVACPACGPELAWGSRPGGRLRGEDALAAAVVSLLSGGIVAVKGLGGYHLACDATDEEAVARLRERKHREEKPLAVMAAQPEALVSLDAAERALLESPARPIVLARRRPDAAVAAAVAPGSPWLGVMLPYTPLHHLLCADAGRPLVMTSGNRSDEPIAVDDADAAERLGAVADGFLSHDRPIHRRCEDSVVRAAFPVRRSRGLTPSALALPVVAPRPLVAAGAELKSTFCVARGGEAFLSPHLGDLDSPLARAAFAHDLELYLAMLGVRPEAVAHDLHPGYASTAWALERGLETVAVQHHHAHAAGCLAEHGETGPALALVWDGTGYGPDGTLWGGELLRADLRSYERLAWLEPVPLPGGEAAIREPWRVAAAYLEAAGRPVPWERWPLVRQSLAVNAPLSSGMGRLFDAAAAVLGLRERVSYEGQAAVELEHLAGDTVAAPYPFRIAGGRLDGAALVAAVHDDVQAGRSRAEVAAAFHEGVAAAGAALCEEAGGPRVVVLSGGAFQNLRLLGAVTRRLERGGFRVLAHRAVPPNDGGISFGQAAVAAARLACA